MGRLGKKLRRELATSPKKAAVLGLLLLVALYYWAPLVWGWVSKPGESNETGKTAAAPTPSTNAPTTASNSAPTKAASPAFPWQQMIQLMDNDERTLAAELRALRRDPFALPKSAAPKPKAEAELAAAAAAAAQSQPVVVTPQSLGLTLSSTIIGGDRRVARISGRTYGQGQTIEVRKDGQTVAFTLAEVHARRVVLVRDENRYELSIPDPLQSKKIELSQSGG
jgi:hypothetical protein